MDAWLATATGIGSGVLGGFYVAFSLVVMPALQHRPAGEAAATMIAINRAAVRVPFLVLFFTTGLLSVMVIGIGLAVPEAATRVLGGTASLIGWALTMTVNVPLNRRLARADRSTVVWPAFARSWTRANHTRAALTVLGALGLLVPLP